MEQSVSHRNTFDPERIIRTLADYGVKYVLIGALAARLQGFPRVTSDADITPKFEEVNIKSLTAALRELKARVYTDHHPEGIGFDCSAKNLMQAEMWNLVTSAGRIDIAFNPAGTSGYDDLMEKAVKFDVFGTIVYAASLGDIIRSKKASDRPQDRQDVILLNEMIQKMDKGKSL